MIHRSKNVQSRLVEGTRHRLSTESFGALHFKGRLQLKITYALAANMRREANFGFEVRETRFTSGSSKKDEGVAATFTNGSPAAFGVHHKTTAGMTEIVSGGSKGNTARRAEAAVGT